MKSVYLVKDGSEVIHFLDEKEMKDAGYSKAEKIVTEEEFNSNGCYARIIDDEIVVGKTAEEKADEERREKIKGLKSELDQIDKEIGAGRAFRKSTIDMSAMLTSLKEIAIGFAETVKAVKQANPELLVDFDPDAAIEKITGFDFSKHVDIGKITESEIKAESTRDKLRPLINEAE